MKKISYTVSCSSTFRDEVERLAARQKVNAGDLVRSVLLMIPDDAINAYPDPGEPAARDRETVLLKSGPSAGKVWQRKPRLQVRLPEGFDTISIRKALALALAMDGGRLVVRVEDPTRRDESEDLAEKMRAAIDAVSVPVLEHGVRNETDALFVMGFAPGSRPNASALRQRFRILATVHHPDSGVGDHKRMAQLNAAMDMLRVRAA